jgi:hypothetical protein
MNITHLVVVMALGFVGVMYYLHVVISTINQHTVVSMQIRDLLEKR